MATHPAVHPSADALRAFALGKLNDSSAATLVNHLDICPECCKQVAALSSDDFLNRLRRTRGQGSTPAPAKALSDVSHAAKQPVSRTPVPNLPPELASNQQYEILRELGRGGMGVVYLAKNKLMDRLEVLKVVNKALLDHPGAVERFLREIRSAAKLSHANVVAAYHALQDGELLAFAMEYVEGQDLASLVKSQGPLPIVNACYYVQQAAWGLQHAFEKGMVHRDIKPQNLILAREGKKHIVKILDFGLAKATREKKDDTGLTGEGKMLGTPDYIAPEQTMDAAKADIRADIYSLGCTLYYLLSGHPPFSAGSLTAVLVAHQMHEARPLNLERPEVPEELAAVVRKMMVKSPAKRYQTPREVVQALDPFVKPGATPKTSPELSAGAAEPQPVVKKAAEGDRSVAPAAKEAKQHSETSADQESLPENSISSVGPRRSRRYSDLTVGAKLGRGSPLAEPRKSRTDRKRPPASVMLGGRKRWLLGGGIGVAVLLLALLGMWASGVFRVKVKTPDGEAIIVLEVDQSGAEVFVDGRKIIVNIPGDNKPVEIQVEPGQHKLRIRKDGFEVVSRDVELQSGRSAPIQVRLEPVKVAGGKPPQPPPDPVNKPLLPVPVSAGEEKGFLPLFNGKNLAGWELTEGGRLAMWHAENGILHMNGLGSGWLMTEKEYIDFELRLEVKLYEKGNSGVALRSAMKGNPAWDAGMEIQLLDDAWYTKNLKGMKPELLTGSIWEIVPRSRNVLKPVGEWNAMSIVAQGRNVIVALNGTEIVNANLEDYKAKLDTHSGMQRRIGRIGLQSSDGRVDFRNLAIKELPATKSEVPAATDSVTEEKGFVPLFNGKDKTGWKTHPRQPGNWSVRKGILIGSGPSITSHLYTERGDYRDFHLRLEARINDSGNSGVYLRTPFGPTRPANQPRWLNGYNAKIDKNRLGGFLLDHPTVRAPLVRNRDPSIPAGQWLRLEVIVQGNHIIVKTNGETTAEYTDDKRCFARGHIALQQHTPQTIVEFRKIEIKELK